MSEKRDIQRDRKQFEQVIESPSWSEYAEFVNAALPHYMDRCEQAEKRVAERELRDGNASLKQKLDLAEVRAWDALGGYKFMMFGYWAAIWVHLNRIGGFSKANPWRELVYLARARNGEGPVATIAGRARRLNRRTAPRAKGAGEGGEPPCTR